MFVFDIESDGLLPGQVTDDQVITKIHCINGIDSETGREYRYTDHEFYQDVEGNVTDIPTPRDGDIKAGIAHIKRDGVQWDGVGGHNINGYDLPAMKYVTGDNTIPQVGFDSQAVGKLAYPTLKDKDFTNIRKGKLPAGFRAGALSLKAWGIRFGEKEKTDFNPKDYGHTWKTMPFTKEMDDYCMDDCRSNLVTIRHMKERLGDHEATEIECRVAEILGRQERHGVRFDEEEAERLRIEWSAEAYELEQEARDSFPPFYVKNGKKKRANKEFRRFVEHPEGGTVRKFKGKEQRGFWSYTTTGWGQPIKIIPFNPGSRVQIENRMRFKYDWEPTELTKTGRAKIDETTLGTLPFKEARTITRYMTLDKRLGQLANGDNAWLKKVKNGRIHGRVDSLGTVTGRMSHFSPNLGQVPANHNPYGKECRALFIADEDRVIVGMDADALELRVLAHFLARFDKGAYVEIVLSGAKEDGTDMHSRTRDAVGLTERDTAKTWFYAFLYGAQNFKLGTIVMSEWSEEKLLKFYKAFPPGDKRRKKIAALGARSRSRLVKTLPALGKLIEKVQENAGRGYLKGLDGRRIPIRAMHAALNSLCQSAGSVVMKKALIIMFEHFDKEGLDVIPLLNVHDEVQLSALKEEAERVGQIAAHAVYEAGEHFNFRCPLAGDYDIGVNWSETH